MARAPLSWMADRIPPEWQDRIVTAATVYVATQYGPTAAKYVPVALALLFGS